MRFLFPLPVLLLLSIPVFRQEAKIVKTDTFEGIICTNFADWKSLVTAKEFWIPTKEEVLKAEERIEAHLKSNPTRYVDLWRKLPNYKRQYVGIIVNGHKRVFCNFFCWKALPLSERPLSEKPVVVFDGGECFFRIEYDLENKECYNFNANGNA